MKPSFNAQTVQENKKFQAPKYKSQTNFNNPNTKFKTILASLRSQTDDRNVLVI